MKEDDSGLSGWQAPSEEQAEAIVKAHVAAHPDIMAVPAAERQAAHARF